MRRPDDTWIKPPPPYPPIATSSEFIQLENVAPTAINDFSRGGRGSFPPIPANTHSLDDFICMQPGRGPGVVLGLGPFVQKFFKPPHLQQQSSTVSESGATTTTAAVNQVQATTGNGAAAAQ